VRGIDGRETEEERVAEGRKKKSNLQYKNPTTASKSRALINAARKLALGGVLSKPPEKEGIVAGSIKREAVWNARNREKKREVAMQKEEHRSEGSGKRKKTLIAKPKGKQRVETRRAGSRASVWGSYTAQEPKKKGLLLGEKINPGRRPGGREEENPSASQGGTCANTLRGTHQKRSYRSKRRSNGIGKDCEERRAPS